MDQFAAAQIKMTDIVAVTVMSCETGYVLSPFFARSDGVLLTDGDGPDPIYLPNEMHDSERLCRLVMDAHATRLICGFVPESARDMLRSAGIDVRLGSCTCTIRSLTAGEANLPKA